MTKRDKGTLVGLLILFGCVLYSGGPSAGLDFIKTISDAVALAVNTLGQIAIQFRDELGITDWLWARGIYGAIAIAAALLTGYTIYTQGEEQTSGDHRLCC